jgi:hypothetical protein
VQAAERNVKKAQASAENCRAANYLAIGRIYVLDNPLPSHLCGGVARPAGPDTDAMARHFRPRFATRPSRNDGHYAWPMAPGRFWLAWLVAVAAVAVAVIAMHGATVGGHLCHSTLTAMPGIVHHHDAPQDHGGAPHAVSCHVTACAVVVLAAVGLVVADRPSRRERFFTSRFSPQAAAGPEPPVPRLLLAR